MSDRYEYLKTNDKNTRDFKFFKLYKYLLSDESFNSLSIDAKIAYSLFENRHQSSIGSPEFYDGKKHFIYFSREELTETLNCSTHKAASIMKELIDFGLLSRQLRNNFTTKKLSTYKIYVNDYVDFINDKPKKKRKGLYDPIKSRDFISVPYSLFDKDKELFSLPTAVKVTYAILLNLSFISTENGFVDDNDNIYVIYTINDLMNTFGGSINSEKTARNYCNQLLNNGLIERKRINNKNVIYVKNIFKSVPVNNCTTDEVNICTTDPVKACTTEQVKNYTTVPEETCTTEAVKSCTTEAEKPCITASEEIIMTEDKKACKTETVKSCTTDPVKTCTTAAKAIYTLVPVKSCTSMR